MQIYCTPVFKDLSDEFMRLPVKSEVFDCVATERMFAVMGVALRNLMALQRTSLTNVIEQSCDAVEKSSIGRTSPNDSNCRHPFMPRADLFLIALDEFKERRNPLNVAR
jgi:hypothetical protein